VIAALRLTAAEHTVLVIVAIWIVVSVVLALLADAFIRAGRGPGRDVDDRDA
jgi:hypothetical protein